MEPKHDKVHLLIISETGRVKSRKISIRLVKYTGIVFAMCFITTSYFTYRYLQSFCLTRKTAVEKTALGKQADRLRATHKEQVLQITQLKAEVTRLKKENEDLKRHFMAQKTRSSSAQLLKLAAYQKFIAHITSLKNPPKVLFQIRAPKVTVSPKETRITFKLIKETLKKVYGRYILMGIYKPDNPEKIGVAVADPFRSLTNFKLYPGRGHPFKIGRRSLFITATLAHPNGIQRFSELHIFIFGTKRELLLHETFKAP